MISQSTQSSAARGAGAPDAGSPTRAGDADHLWARRNFMPGVDLDNSAALLDLMEREE